MLARRDYLDGLALLTYTGARLWKATLGYTYRIRKLGPAAGDSLINMAFRSAGNVGAYIKRRQIWMISQG